MTQHRDPHPFAQRRARLAALMAAQGGGVAVLSAAPEKIRNRDTHHPYRQDSYFYYLTGFNEPDAVLLIVAAGDASPPRSVLFCRPKDPEKERWEGHRLGPECAQACLAMDEAWPMAALEAKWPELMANQPQLWTAIGRDPVWDARWHSALEAVRARAREGVQAPSRFIDVHAVLDSMRLLKDATEKALMQKAAVLSCEAHKRAMALAAPGVMEYALEAELTHCFQRQGARALAYPSIVASGPNACTLHYTDNTRALQDGELVLIDAGCEWEGYAADITRTFPVNGRFEGAARALYEVVLKAQEAALATLRPGATFNDPHHAAVGVIAEGLHALGFFKESLETVLEKTLYTRFYMHRTGHWLGMDVHDAGAYRPGGQWQILAPGMAMTVEPGCYVSPAEDVPPAFWNIGIRIEDDVWITDEGHEVLTLDVPKHIDAIEHWMREHKTHGHFA